MAPRRAGTLRSPSGKKHTVFGTEWMCIGRLITVISASTSVIWTGSSVIGLVACPTCAVSALRAAHCSAYSTPPHAAARRTTIQTLTIILSCHKVSPHQPSARVANVLVTSYSLSFWLLLLLTACPLLSAHHSLPVIPFCFGQTTRHFLKHCLVSPNMSVSFRTYQRKTVFSFENCSV